jgi:class 3 adenylate cyclase
MVKRGNVLILLALVFLAGFVSANIEITQQPFEVYNFGDTVFTAVSVNPANVNGSFEINLVCGSTKANFYKIAPAESAFSPNVLQKINHKLFLTKEYISSMSGDCFIETFLGSEIANSNHFLLTGDITLNAKTDKTAYNPGEAVLISIDAKKANGVLLNGNYEVSGSAILSGVVEKGIATTTYNLANNVAAGKYELIINAYDSDSSGILNQKSISIYYEVKQVPTKLDIGLSEFEAEPNQNYTFSVDLTDQSGLKMPGNVVVNYISPINEQNSFTVESGAIGSLLFNSDSTPGQYILTAKIGNLSVEKKFSVKEVANISVVLLGELNMVSVTNIGNVPYKDSLNVTIGNETETILVNLKLGEEKRYTIRAPNGIYDVIAQTGIFSAASQLSLTGRAVSVGKWDGLSLLEEYSFIWFFVAAILVIAGIIVFLKFRQKREYTPYVRAKEKTEKKMKEEELNEVSKRAFQKKQFVNAATPIINEAQSVPTVKGNKDYCSVLALNVKNYATLGTDARAKLNEIITNVKDRYGVLDFRGQHILIIYSPLITKTAKNEITASKAAWKLRNDIDSYNSKFRDKIKYNLGLSSGEIVSSLAGGKFTYTTIGNGAMLAKRISDLADGKILASQQFRQKLMRELKVNKIPMMAGGAEVFEIISMADVDKNQEKLNDIVKRSNFMRTE